MAWDDLDFLTEAPYYVLPLFSCSYAMTILWGAFKYVILCVLTLIMHALATVDTTRNYKLHILHTFFVFFHNVPSTDFCQTLDIIRLHFYIF